VKRRGEWVDGGGRAVGASKVNVGETKEDKMNPWDNTAFKDNLIESLHQRLLMKMCFVALSKAGEVGRLRKRLVVR
jgi:hypothetical protein